QRGAVTQVSFLPVLLAHWGVVNQHDARLAAELRRRKHRLESRELRRADLAPGAGVTGRNRGGDTDERDAVAELNVGIIGALARARRQIMGHVRRKQLLER